jgi:hypothetical protein
MFLFKQEVGQFSVVTVGQFSIAITTLQDKDQSNTLVTSGPHLDLGGFLDIVKGNEPKQTFQIQFEIDKSGFQWKNFLFPHMDKFKAGPIVKYDLTFALDMSNNKIVINKFRVSDKTDSFVYIGAKREDSWQISGIPEAIQPYARVSFDHFIPTIQLPTKQPKINDDNLESLIGHMFFTSTQSMVLSKLCENMLYVGPVRQKIPRYGVLGSQHYSELGPSGENLMRVLSKSQLGGKQGEAVTKQLNYWLEKKFKVLKNIRILDIDKGKTIKALIADDPRGDENINLAAMGSGVSQLVPVVVQTVMTPPKGCIIIEQPEIHLHPAAQASLGDLFVQSAKRNRQLIIETHSEHLVLRIRRRIAEGKLSPDKVRFFFVDKYKRKTRVRHLPIKSNGHFKRWPAGFFEEGYKEAMALAMAQDRDSGK